jgi:hypothetical protein
MIYSVKISDKDETNRTIEFKIDDYTNDVEIVASLDDDHFIMNLFNSEAVKLQEFLKHYL